METIDRAAALSSASSIIRAELGQLYDTGYSDGCKFTDLRERELCNKMWYMFGWLTDAPSEVLHYFRNFSDGHTSLDHFIEFENHLKNMCPKCKHCSTDVEVLETFQPDEWCVPYQSIPDTGEEYIAGKERYCINCNKFEPMEDEIEDKFAHDFSIGDEIHVEGDTFRSRIVLDVGGDHVDAGAVAKSGRGEIIRILNTKRFATCDCTKTGRHYSFSAQLDSEDKE